MRGCAILLLLLCSMLCSAQNLKEVSLDGMVTIKLPEPYKAQDSVGRLVITSETKTGLFVISRIMNTGRAATSIADEKELVNYYEGFRNGFSQSTKGSVVSEKMIQVGNLRGYQFVYRVENGADTQIVDCIALFIKDRTFAFQFWQLESNEVKSRPVKGRVFSSINVSESLTEADQRNAERMSAPESEESTAYNMGYGIGKIVGILVAPLAIIIVLIFILRKRRSQK